MSNYMVESYLEKWHHSTNLKTRAARSNEKYKGRGNASLSDNLKYINDTVSHLEINRFCGTKDTDGYQVVCKAHTINVVSGKKAFVIWAVQEGYDGLETVVQKAKDELQNRIALGMPVLQYASPDEDIKNLIEY